MKRDSGRREGEGEGEGEGEREGEGEGEREREREGEGERGERELGGGGACVCVREFWQWIGVGLLVPAHFLLFPCVLSVRRELVRCMRVNLRFDGVFSLFSSSCLSLTHSL